MGRDGEAAAEVEREPADVGGQSLVVLADVTVRADVERVLSGRARERTDREVPAL